MVIYPLALSPQCLCRRLLALGGAFPWQRKRPSTGCFEMSDPVTYKIVVLVYTQTLVYSCMRKTSINFIGCSLEYPLRYEMQNRKCRSLSISQAEIEDTQKVSIQPPAITLSSTLPTFPDVRPAPGSLVVWRTPRRPLLRFLSRRSSRGSRTCLWRTLLKEFRPQETIVEVPVDRVVERIKRVPQEAIVEIPVNQATKRLRTSGQTKYVVAFALALILLFRLVSTVSRDARLKDFVHRVATITSPWSWLSHLLRRLLTLTTLEVSYKKGLLSRELRPASTWMSRVDEHWRCSCSRRADRPDCWPSEGRWSASWTRLLRRFSRPEFLLSS